MHEITLQTQIQDIVDDAISRIHELTRTWVIQEVASTFGGTGAGKVEAKKAVSGKAKRKLSPKAKANLMKNLEKAWSARREQAAALRATKEKKMAKSSSKRPKRPTRKPAQKSK